MTRFLEDVVESLFEESQMTYRARDELLKHINERKSESAKQEERVYDSLVEHGF